MTPSPTPPHPRRTARLAGLCVALALACAPALARKHAKAAKQPAAAAPAASAASASAAAPPAPYARREDVALFAEQLAERNGLDADWVRATLAAARYQPSVARLVMPPPAGTAKNWAAYRARFVEPRRIAAGVAFWRANEATLARAEAEYGVPPEIVTGIIGVETLYGRHMGAYRAIDALATLAFDFPAGRSDRSAFFRDELEQLLVMCGLPKVGRMRCDPLAQESSYAGAIGMPQFMPSSVNRYAVDFDGDGRIDLRNSSADVIGSVARYLAEFGWKRGMPTHYAVAPPVDASKRAVLLVPDIVPSFSAERMAELGAELDADGQSHKGLLALVELQNGDAAPSYVAGTDNFYVVTRYNWSSYYALAVIELGQAVRRQGNVTERP
jgi:membrane-bound lytic murein transglycosylase B